eukprot:CAMPEP_0114226846 /NCGR_PEP_ID=MMETSP0058-20121206/1461_1 /TAXON_ID=36894 /ORGANISM="Pyramimonas parkeae, CCMP726" /LENGTH=353 /DNA_ID=CAMNT_0001337621 /DNA_START=43 /DNA_END=1104 /DNA_ORIENTATION=-
MPKCFTGVCSTMRSSGRIEQGGSQLLIAQCEQRARFSRTSKPTQSAVKMRSAQTHGLICFRADQMRRGKRLCVISSSVSGESEGIATPLRAYDGCQLAVHYIGTAVESGACVQTTWDRKEGPLIYTLGSMQGHKADTASARIMQQFDVALLGMQEGGVKKFVMTPEQAYGELDESLIMDIPMAAVKQAVGLAAETLEIGDNILLPDGRSARVKEKSETNMKVDLNHALAGLNIEFELSVMEVAEPGKMLEAMQAADVNIATVSHILVEQRELAVEIKKKLEEGLDFGVLAQAHSTCPSKVDQGKLGTFQAGQMVAEFDKVVFDPETTIGVVQGPLETQFGYHLILVEQRTMNA